MGQCEGTTMSGANAQTSEDGKTKMVMGHYCMYMRGDGLMGEGTSSICRKGYHIDTGQEVAIKKYKMQTGSTGKGSVLMVKFQRQIEVLKELQKPLTRPPDPRLWHEMLGSTQPADIFMQLIDYSKDRYGMAGPDSEDGVMYVITELASYSLKDYFKLRRDQRKPMSKETVRSITQAIVLATAGLHAKGLVHLDLKPENIMLFGGILKLIDVDGCVKSNTIVSIDDSSISFSPCYCAPEWAGFLIDDRQDTPTLTVSPALDAWSIGMTLCELVTLDAVLKPVYASFLKHGRSARQASFHFLEWLNSTSHIDLPKKLQSFDALFLDLLNNWLLACKVASRKSLAECLGHPFMTACALSKSKTSPLNDPSEETMPKEAPRHVRPPRSEDVSSEIRHKGTLFKLNVGGVATDAAQWLKRDMWIAANGSLCYFSQKANARLVLIDGHAVHNSRISRFSGGAFPNAFQIETVPDHDDHDNAALDVAIFACEAEADLKTWLDVLERSKTDAMATMHFSLNMAHELREFKLAVKNRRMKVPGDMQDNFQPLFKGKLWKVKAEGDPMNAEHWFERDMWLTKNGLVYLSKKEEKQLIYYTAHDIMNARLVKLPTGQACKPWAFQVTLAAANGIEFAPGDFAADSEILYNQWVHWFLHLGATLTVDSPADLQRPRASLWSPSPGA